MGPEPSPGNGGFIHVGSCALPRMERWSRGAENSTDAGTGVFFAFKGAKSGYWSCGGISALWMWVGAIWPLPCARASVSRCNQPSCFLSGPAHCTFQWGHGYGLVGSEPPKRDVVVDSRVLGFTALGAIQQPSRSTPPSYPPPPENKRTKKTPRGGGVSWVGFWIWTSESEANWP